MLLPEHLENNLSNMITQGLGLEKGSSIFTIGPCTTRDLEEYLCDDFHFPVLEFDVPKTEYYFHNFNVPRTRGILNHYNPCFMLQELENNLYKKMPKFFHKKDGTVVDISLRGYVPVEYERAIERRKQIHKMYEKIKDCDAIILHYCATEQFTLNNVFCQHIFPQLDDDFDTSQFSSVSFYYEETVEQLKKTVNIIRSFNKDIKIIFELDPGYPRGTMEPVNLGTRNFIDKAIIRAAILELEKMHEVYYFPLYEIVLDGPRCKLDKDYRHIDRDYYKEIIIPLYREFILR